MSNHEFSKETQRKIRAHLDKYPLADIKRGDLKAMAREMDDIFKEEEAMSDKPDVVALLRRAMTDSCVTTGENQGPGCFFCDTEDDHADDCEAVAALAAREVPEPNSELAMLVQDAVAAKPVPEASELPREDAVVAAVELELAGAEDQIAHATDDHRRQMWHAVRGILKRCLTKEVDDE